MNAPATLAAFVDAVETMQARFYTLGVQVGDAGDAMPSDRRAAEEARERVVALYVAATEAAAPARPTAAACDDVNRSVLF